jgi:thiol-disulfide isomerase/thioredoxin
MNKNIEITLTLIHAPWCPYCQEFYPKWVELENYLESNKPKGIKINTERKNEQELGRDNLPTINGNKVSSFPTIKITIKKNNNVEEYKYDGERKKKLIVMNALKKAGISNNQTGGYSKKSLYKRKMNKYHIKYLKSIMNK